MKAYSIDLRQRVVAAHNAGMGPTSIKRTFSVGRATVYRYLDQFNENGSLDPKQRPGRPGLIRTEQYQALVAQLEHHPDATLAEHCALWSETQGAHVSESTMHRAIARVGWTRKKRQ
jgi:transposase